MSLQIYADRVFLALTVWREARGEAQLVKIAVAHSILNRVHRPAWWGRNLTEVIFKKWQYSSLTDPKDRQLTTWPAALDLSWVQSLQTAFDVMDGNTINPVLGADSYYDVSIPAPNWATEETFVAQLGRIRFHNLDHDVEAEVTDVQRPSDS